MFILPFSTKRIRAEMRELTVRQAVDLCQIPDHLNELGIGRALNAIVAETNLPLETWTVQERYAAIGHYITALEQGDWQVSDNAMYSDYTTDKDHPEQGYTFQESDGTTLEIVPLTGEYAEACERAVASMGTAAGNWVVAAMAATIRLQGSDWDGTPDAFVQENITRLMDMPESDFARLHQHFQQAWFEQAHGFDLGFDGDGIFLLSPIIRKGVRVCCPCGFHLLRVWGKQRRNYGAQWLKTAQTVAISRSLDFNAVMQWRISDLENFIGCTAWENAAKAEESQFRFWSELAASVNKTIAASGDAIVKTLANLAKR